MTKSNPRPDTYPTFYPFEHAYSSHVSGRPIVIVDVAPALWYNGYTLTGLGGWAFWFIAGCKGKVFHELRPKDKDEVRSGSPSRFYFDHQHEADQFTEGYPDVPVSRTVFPRLPLKQKESMRVTGVFYPPFSNDICEDSMEAYMWYRNQAKSYVYNSDGLLVFSDVDDLAAFKLKFG